MLARPKFLWIVVLLLSLATRAWAAPMEGIGVFGGLASHTSSGEITSGEFSGSAFSLSSTGLSIGVDYQYALSEKLTLNPFLMISSESASSGDLDFTSAAHQILGAQLRYWTNEFFVGGHAGSYSETLSGAGEAGGSGFGFGLAGGWERADGLFVTGQYDSAAVTFSDATSNVSGFRISAGFRWPLNFSASADASESSPPPPAASPDIPTEERPPETSVLTKDEPPAAPNEEPQAESEPESPPGSSAEPSTDTPARSEAEAPAAE